MQRLCFFLSILVFTSLLVGCASNANAQSQEIKSVESSTPTDLPEKPTPTEVATLESVPLNPPVNCPVTVPQNPLFTPPAPYNTLGFKDHFWFGSNSLWTLIPANGVWGGLPYDPPTGLTQKIFWWREGYVWAEEPQPNLIVTGERLDAPAPPLHASKATNAYASDIGSAMLVGVDFPTLGCWKITGQYKDAELSFVVWVAS